MRRPREPRPHPHVRARARRLPARQLAIVIHSGCTVAGCSPRAATELQILPHKYMSLAPRVGSLHCEPVSAAQQARPGSVHYWQLHAVGLDRFHMLRRAALALLQGLLLAGTSAATPATNFVLMMSDDTGWGDMGYQNGTASTPHLDTWAAADSAIRFERFYAGSPICSPTRASFLT